MRNDNQRKKTKKKKENKWNKKKKNCVKSSWVHFVIKTWEEKMDKK